MPRERGFTLLEILVALAIAVVGIAAIAKTAGGAVDVMQTAENRLFGSWIASNRLAELRLSRAWPAATTVDRVETYAGRDWYYTEQITETADPDLLRIDLVVYSDQDYQYRSASLFGYLSRYSPPAEVLSSDGQTVEDEITQDSLNEQSTDAPEPEAAPTLEGNSESTGDVLPGSSGSAPTNSSGS